MLTEGGLVGMSRSFGALRFLFLAGFLAAAAAVLLQSGYALAVLLACAVFCCLRRRPIPQFTFWLLAGGIALRVAGVFVLHPPLESDFRMMYEAAQSLLAGDVSFSHTPYFTLWAYQSVFVAWQAMWLRLWNNPLCLELVNAVLAAGTVCLLYRMVRPHVHESAAQTAAVLLTLFPFALSLPTLLSNQIPSAFFLTLGLWLAVSADCKGLRLWRFALAGLALQLGNLLRAEGIIVLVAVLAWAVFELLRRREGRKRLICGLLLLLAVYGGVHAAADGIVRTSGLNENGLSNGDPTWKFVTGLNYKTAGGYSDDDWTAIAATLDENHRPTAETDALQSALLEERLHVPPLRLVRHFAHKTEYLWCADALDWAFGHTQNDPTAPLGLSSHERLLDMLKEFDRGLFFLALALAAWGLIGPRGRWGARETAAYLPYFVVFAAFCALLLIEVQPRYAYLPQLYVFTAAAFGLDRLGEGRKNEG